MDILRRVEMGTPVESLPAGDLEIFQHLQQVSVPLLAPNSYLFLDVDGVLNTASSHAAEIGRLEWSLLSRLRKLVEDTNCALVVTSVRRTDQRWCARFVAALERAGLARGRVADCTPVVE